MFKLSRHCQSCYKRASQTTTALLQSRISKPKNNICILDKSTATSNAVQFWSLGRNRGTLPSLTIKQPPRTVSRTASIAVPRRLVALLRFSFRITPETGEEQSCRVSNRNIYSGYNFYRNKLKAHLEFGLTIIAGVSFSFLYKFFFFFFFFYSLEFSFIEILLKIFRISWNICGVLYWILGLKVIGLVWFLRFIVFNFEILKLRVVKDL